MLIGDVIVADVIDEDEVKTGHQRAGMYFGMSGFIITLSGLLVSSVFGLVMPAFGYDTLLDVQPASVEMGFRIFLTVPTYHRFPAGDIPALVVPTARQLSERASRTTWLDKKRESQESIEAEGVDENRLRTNHYYAFAR